MKDFKKLQADCMKEVVYFERAVFNCRMRENERC